MAKIEEMIKEIETMTVLELCDLVKAIEEKFGVTAQAPVAAVAAGAAGAAAVPLWRKRRQSLRLLSPAPVPTRSLSLKKSAPSRVLV